MNLSSGLQPEMGRQAGGVLTFGFEEKSGSECTIPGGRRASPARLQPRRNAFYVWPYGSFPCGFLSIAISRSMILSWFSISFSSFSCSSSTMISDFRLIL